MGFEAMFVISLVIAVVILPCLLWADRMLTYRIIGETGFRAMRIKVYLSLAGVVWVAAVSWSFVTFAGVRLLSLATPTANVWLLESLMLEGLVVPLLIVRSANLVNTYRT